MEPLRLAGECIFLGKPTVISTIEPTTGRELSLTIISKTLPSHEFPVKNPLYYLTSCAEALCPKCAQDTRERVSEDSIEEGYIPWGEDVLDGAEVKWQEEVIVCGRCCEPIE